MFPTSGLLVIMYAVLFRLVELAPPLRVSGGAIGDYDNDALRGNAVYEVNWLSNVDTRRSALP